MTSMTDKRFVSLAYKEIFKIAQKKTNVKKKIKLFYNFIKLLRKKTNDFQRKEAMEKQALPTKIKMANKHIKKIKSIRNQRNIMKTTFSA